MNASQLLVVLLAAMTVIRWGHVSPTPQPSVRVVLVATIVFFVAVGFVVRSRERVLKSLAHLTPARRLLAQQLFVVTVVASAVEMLPRLATGLATGTMPSELPFWMLAVSAVGQLAWFAEMFLVLGPRPGFAGSTGGKRPRGAAGFDGRAVAAIPAGFGVVCLAAAMTGGIWREGPRAFGWVGLLRLGTAALLRWGSSGAQKEP